MGNVLDDNMDVGGSLEPNWGFVCFRKMRFKTES